MTDYRREGRRLARLVRFSIELLAAHKQRTALSISGLFVGVATVMVMVAVGRGAERRVVGRVRAMGSDLVIVTAPPAARVAGRQRQVSTATALRPADADAIAHESPLAKAAAPAVQRTLVAKFGDRNANVSVSGTTTDGLDIRRIAARAGRIFDETEDREQRRVALLGPTVARLLFAEMDPVGREIRIGAVPFEVIAVLVARGIDAGGTDLDNEIVVPLQTAMRRLLNIPFVHTILVQASAGGSERLDGLETDVREILQRRHPTRAGEGDVQPFVVQNQAVLLRTELGAARTLNRVIVAVALLALLIGGVGVVAVMLLSVRERVREIGLRRAVGARRRDIQLQFLTEATLLAAVGGAAGVVGGMLVSAGASVIGRWDLVFSWWAALAGLAASSILGLSVGAIPAARAVRLDPNVALRSG
ncbi:MAG: ABC transporter permease [Gemmatimonadaceae bacterium]